MLHVQHIFTDVICGYKQKALLPILIHAEYFDSNKTILVLCNIYLNSSFIVSAVESSRPEAARCSQRTQTWNLVCPVFKC